MILNPITLKPDASLRDAHRLMRQFSISGVPIVEDGNRLVGILNGVDYREWNPENDELIPENYWSVRPGPPGDEGEEQQDEQQSQDQNQQSGQSQPQPGEHIAQKLFDYDRDIQPIWDKHCTECHGTEKAEGDLNLCGEPAGTYSVSYNSLIQLSKTDKQLLGNRKLRLVNDAWQRDVEFCRVLDDLDQRLHRSVSNESHFLKRDARNAFERFILEAGFHGRLIPLDSGVREDVHRIAPGPVGGENRVQSGQGLRLEFGDLQAEVSGAVRRDHAGPAALHRLPVSAQDGHMAARLRRALGRARRVP